jgi:hypothetical protein
VEDVKNIYAVPGAKYDLRRRLETRTMSTRLKVYKFKRLSLKQGMKLKKPSVFVVGKIAKAPGS